MNLQLFNIKETTLQRAKTSEHAKRQCCPHICTFQYAVNVWLLPELVV